ncbi:hypothetical protein [Sphingomonas sp. C3-2]|uniref:hypothetical protein n=1 Tax=Sphingomonas sp. C3-2 TaxID=3062169 RepID=UPI00294B67FA|nr:hypothetical protein [Sphingomonas sp. C3-2]WOK35099.1 hypothetical protein QYC26_08605 [Sphingomonas sp. C3-2]
MVMAENTAKSNFSHKAAASNLWRFNTILLYLLVSFFVILYSRDHGQTFLLNSKQDGFTSQVNYIWNYVDGDNSIFQLDPLLWIHALRALIAYVFVSIEDAGGNAAVYFTILAMTLPILNVFSRFKRGFIVVLLPISMAALSPRTILVIISVAYLIIYMRAKSGIGHLIVSFVFTNLSSGVVMNNLLISSTVIRNHKKSISLNVYIALLFISLTISVSDKYSGFIEQRAGYDSAVYGATGFWAILSRSTIYTSAINADYARLFVYIALASLAVAMLFFTLRSRQYRGYFAIMLSAIPSLAFEGLGFVSLLVPILLLLAGARLPWHPQESVKRHD